MTPAEATSINARLDTLVQTVNGQLAELRETIADLKAALAHPDPTHCTQRERVEDHETRIRVLESTTGQASGGVKFAGWLLPLILGSLGAIVAALIGAGITYLVNH